MYIFPPRPKGSTLPQLLKTHESSGNWVVQRKFNGQRTGIWIPANRDIKLFNRHGEEHRNYKITNKIHKEIISLNLESGCSYWLDGELISNKTKNYKDKIVIFDILFLNKNLFQKQNMVERYEIVKAICNNPTKLEPINKIALEISESLWLAETFFENFSLRFKEKIHLDEIEGLVLKKKNSTIDNIGRKEYETDWLVRCKK